MLTAEELLKKIRSARDLYDIVRTMKSLAAVSIHHYEGAVKTAAEYYTTVELGLQVVLRNTPKGALYEPEEKPGLGAVIFGSDQGLCGGFNDRIVSYALSGIDGRRKEKEDVTVLCVGERAAALLEAWGRPFEEFVYMPDTLQGIVPQVQKVVIQIEKWQSSGRIGSVVLFHNRLISRASFGPYTANLLPLDSAWLKELRTRKWRTREVPSFSMDRSRLFSSLIRQYLFVTIYRAFAESMAAENASRLSSMQAAEKNIEDRLAELNSSYRQQRQSSITSELIDIVSGFEAQRGNHDRN